MVVYFIKEIMEQLCHFVSSRGILKSCNFHSLNPTSSCNNDILYLKSMIVSGKMFNGMSIYVCSDLLQFFVLQILPKIKNTFVLVSGDSDLCVPREALTYPETMILLNNPYLLKWFIQNTQIQDNIKIIQLPIGLDYHTISNNPTYNWKKIDEGHLPRDQEETLFCLIQHMIPFYERTPDIYVNFTISNDKFGQRESAFQQIPNNLLSIHQDFIKRTDNWKNITKHAFVLSPFGMGMDCHRTWEALCLGAIPIVKAPNFQKLFEDLPVLIVNEWTEITQELLDKTLIDFKNKNFSYEKLTLEYWKKLLKNT